MNTRLFMLLVTLCLPVGAAHALHIDVVVGASAGKLTTGFCANGAQGCDALPVLQQLGLPAGTVPRDLATGRQIFVTDFGDFAGGPFAVDDPGFFAGAGTLPANLLIRYNAIGSLLYWSPNEELWKNSTPAGERIRLFGGLDLQTVISTDTSHCKGLLICVPRSVTSTVSVQGSTIFTGGGVLGASSLIVGNTSANGSLHSHLDWFLELPSGQRTGAQGAYMVTLQMSASGFQASDPFMIMFNRGLDDLSFGRALASRVLPPPPPPSNWLFNGNATAGTDRRIMIAASGDASGSAVLKPGTKESVAAVKLGPGTGSLIVQGTGTTLDVDTLVEIGVGGTVGARLTVAQGGVVSASMFEIGAGGLLEGHGGTLRGDVLNRGIVAPGQSPGILSIDGDFVQDDGGRLIIEIAGPEPGSQYDRLIVSGNALLDGTLELRLLDGFLPELGAEFLFLTASAIGGGFDEVIAPVFGGNRTFRLDFAPGGIRAQVAPVPLPAAVWMMSGALAVLWSRRRPPRSRPA